MNLNKHYDWLIVGLGNPGTRYENTRHNIGWMVLDQLAEKFGKEFIHKMYFNTFDMNIHDNDIAVIKPNIFMNNSGEPILRFSSLYNIPVDKILIIYDEYNFPVGKIHLRGGGSDGGHNGIASIIEKLDGLNFLRLRCGIGNDFKAGEMADYVLSDFPKEQKSEVELMIKKASESIEYLIENGLNKSMSAINSGELWNIATPHSK
jgi:PTH1 family peptidyl-tRNA hydrolase